MSEIHDLLNRAKTSVERGKASIQRESMVYNEFGFNGLFVPSTAIMAPLESTNSATINPDFNPWGVNDDGDHTNS